jgi:hypothetical protein
MEDNIVGKAMAAVVALTMMSLLTSMFQAPAMIIPTGPQERTPLDVVWS